MRDQTIKKGTKEYGIDTYSSIARAGLRRDYKEYRCAAVTSPNLNRLKSDCRKNCLDRTMAGVGEEDRFTGSAEEVAAVTTPARPRYLVENMKRSSMEEEEDAVIMPSRLDGKKGTCGDPKCKVGSHPRVKNMMFLETIESILSYEKPARRDPKKDETADFFNKLNDNIAEFQQEIWKEVEEKGYVEVPDNYEEEAAEIMLEGYKLAYLKVFGTDPPAELLNRGRLS
ncbi:hypothetical protein ACQJBY_047670 [Aegilops geniculata]